MANASSQWRLVSSQRELEYALDDLLGGYGPIGVDAERASGFRYGNDAYLVQLFRTGSQAFLIDPISVSSFADVQEALSAEEWIFHAASQDLPSLEKLGLKPQKVFDTELASRLLGLPRVGLGSVVEEFLGVTLEKAHSAADWSTRPLPESWLEYAALDVLLLPALRDSLEEQLLASGKLEFATQEFEHLLRWEPKAEHPEPWRRMAGLNAVSQPRQLAIARELWLSRDALARERDIAPGRLLPDSSIIAASLEPPRSQSHLAAMKKFHGRASRSELPRWWQAIFSGKTTDDLPTKRGPALRDQPPHRTWAKRFPEADARLRAARESLSELADERQIPLENLLTPDVLRRLAWSPPEPIETATLAAALSDAGARAWQRELTVDIIAQSFLAAKVEPHQNE